MRKTPLIPMFFAGLLAAPVFAQDASVQAQRDARQQQRIEAGLQSGQLTTQEAAKLEREESRVDQAEARALRDGNLSNAERQKIDRMQNRVSRDISKEKHNAQTGNPNSASSLRMQADVQRNIHQEQRIGAGLKDGSLTAHEAGRLEAGQAKDDRQEFRAGRDGHVSEREQQHVQRAEDHQSRRIRHERHDG